ncbi:hypothetical protein D1007_31809 [Hordeum vulgare]|nr:hypothetical protein D1007_31809 [Hordeum vulgare]
MVEEAPEVAVRARGLQLECSQMFQSLEKRASCALSNMCGKSVSSPLVPDDAGYLGFFLRVMECLEAGAGKALALAQEKSHLLRLDPYFDFAAVVDPVPEMIHAALDERVEVHVDDLVARLAPEGYGVDSCDDMSPSSAFLLS